jgi:hypothetical protein
MFIYFIDTDDKELNWFVAAPSPERAIEIWRNIPYIHGCSPDASIEVEAYRIPAIPLDGVEEGPLEWSSKSPLGIVRSLTETAIA